MSNYSISTYKFKPFEFQVQKQNLNPCDEPLVNYGHCVVSNNANLILYGGFNPQRSNANGPRRSLTLSELWKYCFDSGEWRIIACKNVPQELVYSYITLSGNIVIIYGRTGLRFQKFCGNHMYLGNLANEFTEDGIKFKKLQVTGDVPMASNGQGVAMYDKYVYSLGGTSSHQYEMDVRQINLSTKTWELLHKSSEQHLEPGPRYRLEVVIYNSKIYVFGGGRGGPRDVRYGFKKIHIFDIITKKWEFEPAKPDFRVPNPGYPCYRTNHSCVQCPENPNLVYICGGTNRIEVFKDVWRFDIDHLQWENLTNCVMPWPVYFHSTTVTPSGRMCTYGGIVCPDSIFSDDDSGSSNNIVSAWIMIPKLEVIAWEAMIYYFKDQMFASTDDDLKKNGIPKKYCDRIIEFIKYALRKIINIYCIQNKNYAIAIS